MDRDRDRAPERDRDPRTDARDKGRARAAARVAARDTAPRRTGTETVRGPRVAAAQDHVPERVRAAEQVRVAGRARAPAPDVLVATASVPRVPVLSKNIRSTAPRFLPRSSP